MALAPLQRRICALVAANRRESGESCVADAAALNELIAAPRLSHDVDLFHDTAEAVASSWDADRRLLEAEGYRVVAVRERPGYVEAEISADDGVLRMEWAQDSAFRFFPLVEHVDFGLVLHPFDLATNKVLALIGRLEVRDWIDLIECGRRLQPLGYLAWAASGKDPGFSPASILEHASRTTHYSADEVGALAFAGPPPDVGLLAGTWRAMLAEAREIVRALPPDNVGMSVLASSGALFTGNVEVVEAALTGGTLLFHAGRIRGALPRIGGAAH